MSSKKTLLLLAAGLYTSFLLVSFRGIKKEGPLFFAVPGPAASEVERLVMTGTIDPNRATLDDLIPLPGIGPGLARRLIEERERHGSFSSVDDLLRVPGIGPATLQSLKPYFSVPGTTY